MLTFNSHWHEIHCDHCGYSFSAPNGAHLIYKGQQISTEDLKYCPNCKAPADTPAEPEPPEPEPPEPEELPEWGVF